MLSFILSLGLFPLRPGSAICKPIIESHYYSTYSCRRNDVVTGIRNNGSELILICGKLKVVCDKNIIVYQENNEA